MHHAWLRHVFYCSFAGAAIKIISTDTNEIEYFKNWLKNDVQFCKGLCYKQLKYIDGRAMPEFSRTKSEGHLYIVPRGFDEGYVDAEGTYVRYQVIRELASRG